MRQPRGRLLALVKEPVGNNAPCGLPESATMPSLFRFLLVVGIIGGLAYVTVFALANFVKFHPREIVVTIPPDQFLKKPQ